MLVSLGRSEGPQAPYEIREAVELYAREWGRTGSISLVQVPGFACWTVRLSLKPNDPRMKAYREGRAPEPEPEVVWLMDPTTGTAFDIYQMGAAGVRAFLERGNTWSGRGEHDSPLAAIEHVSRGNRDARDRFREEMKAENRYERRQDRRRYLQIPQVSPGIDLKSES